MTCTGRANSRRRRAACGACPCTTRIARPGRPSARSGLGAALYFEPGVLDPEIGYDYRAPSWFPAVRGGRGDAERRRLYDLTPTRSSSSRVRGAGRPAAARDVGHRRRGRADRLPSANDAAGSRWTRRSRAGPSTFWSRADAVPAPDDGLLRAGCRATPSSRTSPRASRHSRRRATVTRAARPADRRGPDHRAWPFLRAREIEIGRATGWAFRCRSLASSAGSLWSRRSSGPTCTTTSSRPARSRLRHGLVRLRGRPPRARLPPGSRHRPSMTRSRRNRLRGVAPEGGRLRGPEALERLGRRRAERRLVSVHARRPCCGTASRCSATAPGRLRHQRLDLPDARRVRRARVGQRSDRRRVAGRGPRRGGSVPREPRAVLRPARRAAPDKLMTV